MTGDRDNYGVSSAATSVSLLERIRACDQEAWERFVHLYTPLVYRWCRQAGLRQIDAADVGQEVFRAVAHGIGNYRHDRPSDTFRGWLRVLTRRKVADFGRRQDPCQAAGGSDALARLQRFADDETPEPASEQEDRLLVLRRALDLVLRDFEEKTRQAFWRVVLEGQPAAEVAQALGVTPNAVYLAKSRVLRRLRDEFAGCLDM